MPYNINIDDYNFFSATETVENTMPFRLPQLLTWAKTRDSLPAEEITSVFDPKLAKVVIDNSNNFINEFLPKNIILNSDFSSGNSPVQASNSNSNIIKIGTDYYPTVTLSPAELSADAPYNDLHSFPIKDVDGVISWIFGTTTTNFNANSRVSSDNPLIIYRTDCTTNHLHFPGATGCTIKNSDTTNRCECDGTPVLNNVSHSHCFEFTPNTIPDGSSLTTTIGGQSYSYTNIFEKAYYSYYKKQFDTSLQSNVSPGSQRNGDNPINPYVVSGDKDTANQNAKDLHKLVYDYYVEVYNNLNYKKRFNPTNPNELLMTDTMTKYNYNYLNMFNIISGIIIASGCIIMLRRG